MLEYTNREDGTVRIVLSNQVHLHQEQSYGSGLEFILFFLGKDTVRIKCVMLMVSLFSPSGCFFFSWFGYLIACCLASTVAAQSGAAAGLGLSLVIKVVYFEVCLKETRQY